MAPSASQDTRSAGSSALERWRRLLGERGDPGAEILAVRERAVFQEEELSEELLPVDMDPEIVERCRRLGIELPQRYQAHPAENGHPDTIGTPEDGTRQTVATATSEGKDARYTE